MQSSVCSNAARPRPPGADMPNEGVCTCSAAPVISLRAAIGFQVSSFGDQAASHAEGSGERQTLFRPHTRLHWLQASHGEKKILHTLLTLHGLVLMCWKSILIGDIQQY